MYIPVHSVTLLATLKTDHACEVYACVLLDVEERNTGLNEIIAVMLLLLLLLLLQSGFPSFTLRRRYSPLLVCGCVTSLRGGCCCSVTSCVDSCFMSSSGCGCCVTSRRLLGCVSFNSATLEQSRNSCPTCLHISCSQRFMQSQLQIYMLRDSLLLWRLLQLACL